LRSAVPEFRSGRLHLWSIPLDAHETAPLRALLSPDEQARASRFHFERDAERFIVGRGVLRTILASYLDVPDPSQLALRVGEHGKPVLADGAVFFNLAHSGALGLLGIARDAEIGVDLELVRDFDDMPRVMRASFAPAEVEAIVALDSQYRVAAFYRCWTRKEAVLKALGSGLARPLDSFGVDVGERSPAVLWMDGQSPEDVASWKVQHLTPAAEHIGAVAWTGPDLEIESFTYAP